MGAGRLALKALAILVVMAAPTSAAADGAGRIRRLEETVARQAALIEALELRLRGLEARQAAVAAAPSAGPAPRSTPAPAAASPMQAAAAAVPPEGTSVKLRGRLHADAWAVDGGVSGTEVRRARLGAEGRISGAMPYVVEVDFAGNAVSLQDAYLDYPLGSAAAVRLGYHKVPFSLDDQTSDNYNLFLEHPVGIDAFTPGRGVAAAILAHGERWFAHAGVFGEGENDARDGRFDESVTASGRLVWAPVLGEGRFLHLGLSGFHTQFGDAPGLNLRQRPGRRLADHAIATGPLDAERMHALGLEAAFGAGPAGAAAEYARARVDERRLGALDYAGWSVEGWWALTGELRPYKLNGGVFDRLSPARPVTAGGPGAWVVAARYSTLDLDDTALAAGELSTVSLGLNWHWTSRARLMLELNRAVADRAGTRDRQTGAGARVQYDW